MELKSDSEDSRLEVMGEVQKAHWYYLDELSKEMGLESVGEVDFFKSILYRIAMKGVDPYWAPERYVREWEGWTRESMVGGAALLRFHPVSRLWEVLMVKCYKPHLAELSSTWAGGKADPTDPTLWDTCVREVFEEIGLDLTHDRSRVVAVIENRRVFNVVIPLEYDDPRLSHLTAKAVEIQEISWIPVSTNIDLIQVPRRLQGPIVDDGLVRPKINPPEPRMPPDFQNSFRILQSLLQQDVINHPLANVNQMLNIDPKIWLKQRKSNGKRR